MKTLAIFLLILPFLACLKSKPKFDGVNCFGNCYILTGRVVDTPSRSGLEGVGLKFYYRKAGYFPLGNPSVYLGNTVTTSDGTYKFQFDGNNYKTGAGYFRVLAAKTGFFYGNSDHYEYEVGIFDLDSSRFNTAFNQNFTLFRPAIINVRFRTTTVTNFEFLTFTYKYGTSGSGMILKGNRAIDTTISFRTGGDVRTFINWNAAGNGIRINQNDTLFATRGRTVQYQINL